MIAYTVPLGRTDPYDGMLTVGTGHFECRPSSICSFRSGKAATSSGGQFWAPIPKAGKRYQIGFRVDRAGIEPVPPVRSPRFPRAT